MVTIFKIDGSKKSKTTMLRNINQQLHLLESLENEIIRGNCDTRFRPLFPDRLVPQRGPSVCGGFILGAG
jgi:hypothetical protein